jgi:DNA-binding MarR family transcriptional regulator
MRETSTVTIMFHQAIADRLDMSVTDHKCAGILMQRTGLTTGAITGVVDRLEQAGFARRCRDSADRRRVFIEADSKQIEQRIVPLFESMGRAAAQLYAEYSAAELSLILRFAERSRAIAEEETRKLRELPKPDARRARRKSGD